MKSYVAFFDLDHTIFNVNSGRILIEHAHKRGLIHLKQIILAYLFSALYGIGLLNAEYIMKKLAIWLKGISEKDFIEFSDTVFDKYLKDAVRPDAKKEIDYHKKNNAYMVILSAATWYICRPAKELLLFDDILCSKLEVVDGTFSGNPDGDYCFGVEKLNRVKQYCKKHNFEIKQAYYYADSHSDVMVLKAVGNPVCVTPDSKLKKVALKNGWSIRQW